MAKKRKLGKIAKATVYARVDRTGYTEQYKKHF